MRPSLLEFFPELFDGIELRAVRWQKDQFNSVCRTQELLDVFRTMIASTVVDPSVFPSGVLKRVLEKSGV